MSVQIVNRLVDNGALGSAVSIVGNSGIVQQWSVSGGGVGSGTQMPPWQMIARRAIVVGITTAAASTVRRLAYNHQRNYR